MLQSMGRKESDTTGQVKHSSNAYKMSYRGTLCIMRNIANVLYKRNILFTNFE